MNEPTLAEDQKLRDERRSFYAAWLELSPAERQLRKLPSTQKSLAAEWGVADRTLNKWKNEPAFQALQRQVRRPGKNELFKLPVDTSLAGKPVPEATAVAPEPGDLDELGTEDQESETPLVARSLRDIWYERAKEDTQAANFWYKAWGQDEAEEERRLRHTQYDQATIMEMVLESCTILGPEYLVQYLAEQGWRVEPREYEDGE